MNEYIVVLKGTNKDFAIKEFEILWKTYFNENISLKQGYNTFFTFTTIIELDGTETIFKRLTFTNFCYKSLWSGSSYDSFFKTISKVNFNYLEDKTFAIMDKTYGFTPLSPIKEIAKPIWNSLTHPKVDLDKPDYSFAMFSFNEVKKIFGLSLFENKKEYLTRMPKIRPVAKPYTLKSDMARAASNLLGLKEGSVVLDPFCGIGGILLEMYDLGYDVYGNDIDYNDLCNTQKNFKHYFPHANIHLSLCDAQKQFLKDNFVEGIVTDIPYGKSCRRLGEDLYRKFLEKSSKMLTQSGKLVIIYANFLEFKTIALEYFDEEFEIDQYINKSMMRHILVLKQKE